MKPMKRLPLIILAVLPIALTACAGPGQPPNIFNALAGGGIIASDNIIIDNAVAKINAAEASGKISPQTQQLLLGEAQAAATAFYNLGVAVALNQTVTQDQVTAAEMTFVIPLQRDMAKYLGSPVVVIPQAQTK